MVLANIVGSHANPIVFSNTDSNLRSPVVEVSVVVAGVVIPVAENKEIQTNTKMFLHTEICQIFSHLAKCL